MKHFSKQLFKLLLATFIVSIIFSFTDNKPDSKLKKQDKNEIEQIKMQLASMQNEIDSLSIELVNLRDTFQKVTALLFYNNLEDFEATPMFYDVQLDSYGTSKLDVMNTVYQITGLGLKDSKALLDNAPSIIKSNLSEEEAFEIKSRLEQVGAIITLIPLE